MFRSVSCRHCCRLPLASRVWRGFSTFCSLEGQQQQGGFGGRQGGNGAAKHANATTKKQASTCHVPFSLPFAFVPRSLEFEEGFLVACGH